VHELAVTQSILEIALRHADSAGRITQLNLVVGDLASVVDDSVQFYWDIVSKGTAAEGATLNFKRIRTRFQCRECGADYYPQDRFFECPHCSSNQVTVVAGKEFRLESIEVE
jgi:hydrogenase nickel incorporation protein HypA/HybF